MKRIVAVLLLVCIGIAVPLSVESAPLGAGVENNVYDRALVQSDISPNDIIHHHHKFCSDTQVSHFNGNTLVYITPWNNKGYDIAKKFAKKFSHVSPVWFQVKMSTTTVPLADGSGKKKQKIKVEIQGGHDADQNWLTAVRAANPEVKIVPRFIVEPDSADLYSKLAQRPGLQKLVQEKILAALKQHKLDGLVLEMTDAWAHVTQKGAMKARDDLNKFVLRFGKALHAASKQFIIVVRPIFAQSPYFQNYDLQAVDSVVDGYSLMTYDYSNGPKPGPNSPLGWMEESFRALLGKDIDSEANRPLRSKVMMGLPFYGRRFPLETNKAQVSAIVGHEMLAALEADPQAKIKYHADVAEHSIVVNNPQGYKEEIYYPTLEFLSQRIELARAYDLGLSIWEIGQGLDYFYDMF